MQEPWIWKVFLTEVQPHQMMELKIIVNQCFTEYSSDMTRAISQTATGWLCFSVQRPSPTQEPATVTELYTEGTRIEALHVCLAYSVLNKLLMS
jgi:hypothetical protein